MFETVEAAPPDAILGLNEAFKSDASDRKVNLSVGIYHDASGNTPILRCVKEAERRLVAAENTKSYLRIEGHAQYDELVPRLILGENQPAIAEARVCTAQTPGGTGALRVAADWIGEVFPRSRYWLSSPTWPNHPNIFRAAGRTMQSYRYYDTIQHRIQFDHMMDDLTDVAAGDVVVLHGCCHNPTGADLTEQQWSEVAQLLLQKQALPLIDFAYQGFARGVEPDAQGLRTLSETIDELLVVSSFSKNFGLYRERVGALMVVAKDPPAAAAVLSRLRKCIRCNYSNPPSHGAAIVATVLGDKELQADWLDELATMRERIHAMRTALADAIGASDCATDFSFMTRQHGMFSLSGLTPEQVATLRRDYSIYVVGNGRINVAGLNDQNMGYVAAAIAAVSA